MLAKHGRLRGFTIIELMIVVAVVVILTASVALTLPRFRGDNLLAAATRLQAAIDQSRQASINHRASWSLTFDVKNNRVVYNDSQMTGQTLHFSSQIGFPICFGDVAPERVSVYIGASGNNYVYSNATGSAVLTFDGFGIPNIERLGATRATGLELLPSGYGVVTLETGGGSQVIQILIYANTGRTELRWVKR